MAFAVATGGVSQGIGSVNFSGSWSGNSGFSFADVWFAWGYASFSNETPHREKTGQGSGSWNDGVSIDKDRNAKFRAMGFATFPDTYKQGANVQFKTYADAAAFISGLTPGTPTITSIPVSGSINVNTVESSAIVTIQYRVQGTAIWSETAPIASGLTGSGTHGLGGSITGLTPNTRYEARYRMLRDTANAQEAFSNVGVFQTLSSIPVVVSVPPMLMLMTMPAPEISGVKIAIPPMEMSIIIPMVAVTVAGQTEVGVEFVMANRENVVFIME